MKKVISILLVSIMLFGMLMAYAAGTETDPLITQTYAQGAYRASLGQLIGEKTADLPFSAKLDALENGVGSGFQFAASLTENELLYDDEITLLPGSSFILTSGSASVVFTEGIVINISTGETAASGAALKNNQRYFCAEDTDAVISATSAAKGFTDGYYKVTQSMITRFVARLYTEILGREYDEYGLGEWVKRIKTGMTSSAEIAHGFVFSEELTKRNLTNAEFVEMLYRAIMGRPSETYGKTEWVNRLAGGMTRQEVFDGFIDSVEFRQICIDYGMVPDIDLSVPIGIRLFVNRLYTECLGRKPDAAGADAWMKRIHNKEYTGWQVAHGFVFSREITDKKLSDAGFVEMLYRTMLGRPAEPSGKAEWVSRLESGWSKQTVFEGFVTSVEFGQICDTLGVPR